MAAEILPAPGTKLGPCKGQCKHRDCAQTREDATAPCRFCQQPVGYDKRFYRSRLSGELAHAMCYEEAIEQNDARVGLF